MSSTIKNLKKDNSCNLKTYLLFVPELPVRGSVERNKERNCFYFAYLNKTLITKICNVIFCLCVLFFFCTYCGPFREKPPV